MKEKRYIKRSEVEKFSIPQWMRFFKSAEIYDYILIDDNGKIIKEV